MRVKIKNSEWVQESTLTIHTSTKKAVKINHSADVDTSNKLKLEDENAKLFRRYSFDDNGGGYAGL